MERKGERVGAIVLLNNVYARLLQQSLKVKQVQVDEPYAPAFFRIPASSCSSSGELWGARNL